MVQRENTMKEKREIRFWVRPIFTPKRRFLQGASDNLIPEILDSNDSKYCNFLRLTPVLFEKLLEIVGPKIEKQYAVREPIASRTRLELTLRYLASGDSMASVSYGFRVGKNIVSTIISETCQCIWNELKEKVFLNPTAENWRKVAKDFEDLWNYPNCIGAANANSGSTYYNYKGRHSINLMAIGDAKYCFLMLDIGAEGRQSDGGVFRRSEIGIGFENVNMDLPEPTQIEVNGPELRYVLVADEAFALTPYIRT
ncbi:nuclease harbi1 [Lasius niger]|uniref:Nuclease harbi1 n=1 Tax=Lasius niger TaxID=67767 RepID=A0A0J7K768_LASNI|nr:nuclease harbi1 [Lasius niger]